MLAALTIVELCFCVRTAEGQKLAGKDPIQITIFHFLCYKKTQTGCLNKEARDWKIEEKTLREASQKEEIPHVVSHYLTSKKSYSSTSKEPNAKKPNSLAL
jgi:hypothetical protein